jgi:hypothetical protein
MKNVTGAYATKCTISFYTLSTFSKKERNLPNFTQEELLAFDRAAVYKSVQPYRVPYAQGT